MLALAELLGGLGLLFIGLRLVSQHLQQATGKRVRRILQSATRSAMLGFLSGAGAGAATQSSNAVTLIAGNLVRSGTLNVRNAMPVIAGANVGTAALVFLASVNFHVAVLYLITLVGLCYQLRFDRHPTRRDWAGAGLGLGLLFLGMDFIKRTPSHLDPSVLTTLVSGLDPWIALGLGIAIALVTQSASTATILVIAAISSGMLSLDAGFWMVLGANVGSGAAVLVAGSGLNGSGRQLCLAQVLIKLAGTAAIALVWILVNFLFGIAPGPWLTMHLEGSLALALSILFLTLQLVGGGIVVFSRQALARWLDRLSPPSLEERESRPRYVHDLALQDPPTAVELAVLERNRLIGLLPKLLPDMDNTADNPAHRRAQYEGNTSIATQAENFIVELIDRQLHRDILHSALHMQSSLSMLRSLQTTLHDFSESLDSLPAPRPSLAFTLSESLRTLALLQADAVTQQPLDPADFEVLAKLTGDRGEMLNNLRRDLTASHHNSEQIRSLMVSAGLFERSVWLMGRLTALLAPQ
ncbi:hypothetical protein CR159_12345 [Pollutimonas subterranea]|uniref:Phosphate:Na+ symporter n=1 Tax=Pollutimonas subterranea TaxID=2045210 RepID=A0A2N4U3V8_9BURK|nr:Na/Pi symporter [Pollutimonas subterranea]PLC49698.1 hypothetical protein CR159_12345 [Pollutimonas subterranea]